jgi:serine/threonine-protein kinase
MAIYDVSRGGDMDYIVMELIDGITLKQYMERRGKLNWPEALHFITQIMKGLSHAHSRGIIHRDIKPQNIMVLRDGTVKVTDFGIACLSNSANASNEAIGSVHYISPEQAKGDYTDNRSDIYSAGVVLYEMLTSRLPFDGDTPMSVALQHISAVPLNPREINPDVPEALEQICMKAMASDRNKRYRTADEMLADLEAFRKDPTLSFDYSVEDLRGERREEESEEPTQYIPNVAVTRARPSGRNEPEEVESDEEERPRVRWWKTALLIVVIAAVGYFAVSNIYRAIMDSFTSTQVPEYAVPSVVGLTVEEAQALEEVDGVFTIVESYYENSSEYPAGQIIDQDPEADRMKKSDNGALIPINVTISLGVKSGGMPNVIGMESRSARLQIEQDKSLSGLDITITEGESEYSDTVEEGHVVRTIPAAGETLAEGDTVELILSKGPKIIYSTMIACVDQDMEWVQQEMNRLNLVAEFVREESSKKEGTVLSQSVDVGVSVPEGTTVTFTYSDGELPVDFEVSYAVPESEEPVQVEIYLDSTLVFESELPGDFGTLSLPLSAKAGSYTLRFYVDDQLKEERVIDVGE